jgi:hypothetical protein
MAAKGEAGTLQSALAEGRGASGSGPHVCAYLADQEGRAQASGRGLRSFNNPNHKGRTRASGREFDPSANHRRTRADATSLPQPASPESPGVRQAPSTPRTAFPVIRRRTLALTFSEKVLN